MSGPQRQELTDVTTVTPTLNDKAVTIQANTVKTSLYSAIYNLFKAGYDLVYLTAADLAGYATESYADSAASNAASSAVTTANSYTDIEVAGKQDLFDYSGSANGATTVTIDGAKGGTAEFTQSVIKKTTQLFRINSDMIEATSKIIPVLVYNGSGYPAILHQQLSTGRIDFIVANLDVLGTGGNDTNASIFIEYQIVE
jgi:hypothetical protein